MVKRFYKTVRVCRTDNGFKVLCDNKPLKCGGTTDMLLANENIANIIASEWDNQTEDIDIKSMPFTDFMAKVNGFGQEEKDKVISDIISFIPTDVLFYRAGYPSNLVALQDEKWNPVITWASHYFDVSFTVTNNILPIAQPEKVKEIIKSELHSMDSTLLLGYFYLSSVYTSVLLGLAVIKGHLTAEEAFNLSRLEENFQNSVWGEDKEASKGKGKALNQALNIEKILKTAGYM